MLKINCFIFIFQLIIKSFSPITTNNNLRYKTENVIIIRDSENMIHSNYILSIIKYKFKYNNLKIQENRYSEYKEIKDIL